MVDQRVDEYCKEVLKGTCSEYSGIEVTNYYDRTDIESWSYTLLPVWIITYKYKGKIYPFAINGQTGKLYGSLPADTGRLIAMSSLIAGIAFAFGMLGGIFLYEKCTFRCGRIACRNRRICPVGNTGFCREQQKLTDDADIITSSQEETIENNLKNVRLPQAGTQ